VILADTSVWIEHLRRGVPRLSVALERGEIATHPFVIGELACGNLRNRARILEALARLASSPVATDTEALGFLERRRLMGRGLGWVDIHLLAAVMLSPGMRLWTIDARLADAAERIEVNFQ